VAKQGGRITRLKLRKGLGAYLAISLIILTLIIVSVSRSGYSLRLTRSESLGHSVFLLKPRRVAPNYGDYVAFEAPLNQFVSGEFLKVVRGKPGDTIRVDGRNVFINDKLIGQAKSATRRGFPLTVIEGGVIPLGYYFVAGVHPDSFDSRYGEIGLVHIGKLNRTASVIL